MPVFNYSPGSSGQGSSSSTPLTKRIDTVLGISYLGESAIGTSQTEALWRIKRVSVLNGTATVLWANNGGFNQIWANRLSLTYG